MCAQWRWCKRNLIFKTSFFPISSLAWITVDWLQSNYQVSRDGDFWKPAFRAHQSVLQSHLKLLKLCLDLMKGISQRVCSYFGSMGPTSLMPLPDLPFILDKYLKKAVSTVFIFFQLSPTVIFKDSCDFLPTVGLNSSVLKAFTCFVVNWCIFSYLFHQLIIRDCVEAKQQPMWWRMRTCYYGNSVEDWILDMIANGCRWCSHLNSSVGDYRRWSQERTNGQQSSAIVIKHVLIYRKHCKRRIADNHRWSAIYENQA